jgi:hypothetical protein
VFGSDSELPHSIARIRTSDMELFERSPQAYAQDEAGAGTPAGSTPLASSDEAQPLLRTMTSTPTTVSAFRNQGLLDWDEDTKAVIQHLFWNLFDFVGGPAADSLSRTELDAIASSDDAARSSVAKAFLTQYEGFLQPCEEVVTRVYVHRILDVLSNQVCLSDCDGFRIAFNAHTMRKIARAKKVIASMKMYQPGAKLIICNPDRDSPEQYLRCTFVRKNDRGAFVVDSKGREITVDRVQEPDSDDEHVEADASAAEAAARALQSNNDVACGTDNNNINQSSAAAPYVDPWAHVDWSDEAYARDAPSVLRAIAADFPGFQLGAKLPASEFYPYKKYWPISLYHRGRASERKIKHEIELDEIDYGINFAPFCTPEMLPSLSADDHKRLMDTAAMRESFRCFFLHLAVELGVHPVALQVMAPDIIATCTQLLLTPLSFSSLSLQHVCRERCAALSQLIAERTAADEESDVQFFNEAVDSVLRRRSGYK